MWIFKSMFAQRIFFFFLFLERFDMWSNKKKKKRNLKNYFAEFVSPLSCRTSIQQVYIINVPFVTMIMIICKVETGPGCPVE